MNNPATKCYLHMTHPFLFFSLLLYSSQPVKGQATVAVDSQHKKIILFTPDTFSHKFSLHVKPVLFINSGDTVQTETIDATGRDKKGIKRQTGGNPLTGPFYITNSKAGDVLKIILTRV